MCTFVFLGDYMNSKFMDLAIKEAIKAFENDEVPVGCVIVKDNLVIAKAYNKKEKCFCASKHAEVLAVEKASKKLNNWRLNGCDVYITLEPCPMCASLLKQARVNNIYCGLSNSDPSNFKIIMQILKNDKNNSHVSIYNDLAVEKVSKLMKVFFEKKRNK